MGILRLSLVEHDNMLHFSVYNQGASISPEKLPKIWEKFYRCYDFTCSDRMSQRDCVSYAKNHFIGFFTLRLFAYNIKK